VSTLIAPACKKFDSFYEAKNRKTKKRIKKENEEIPENGK